MLPPKMPGASPDQQKLLRLYRQLTAGDRETLLSFATFLVERKGMSDASGAAAESPLLDAQDIPRPDDETVIAAMRRLTATYPMVEKDDLLHEASGLMTKHVMQGRPAGEVIDELEVVFRRHYERVKS